MSVSNVSTTQTKDVYNNYNNTAVKGDTKAADVQTTASESAAVYEKSDNGSDKKATYSINKMSAEERSALVQQLKADQESRKQSLVNLVQNMMSGQAKTAVFASDDEDSMWKFLASGEDTVDEAAKRMAIGE